MQFPVFENQTLFYATDNAQATYLLRLRRVNGVRYATIAQHFDHIVGQLRRVAKE